MTKKYLFFAIIGLFALAACNNDTDIDLFDSPAAEGGTGTLSQISATVSTLQVSWQAIDGVIQYGYKLSDHDGKAVRQGVTKATQIEFTNLEADTRYTFEIEALGANGSPTMHFSTVLATNPIVTLATPDAARTVMTIVDGRVTITWPAVDQAEYYTYALEKADGTEILDGETTDTFVSFGSMAIGDYVLKITACTSQEGFLPSEEGIFAFTREHQVVETRTGTYKSAVLGSFECQLDIYDDGVYAIRAFLGVEGYDLEYSVSSDKVISILNAYLEEGSYKYVATGLDETPTMIVYQDPEFCTYSVLPSGKRIKIYVYFGDSDAGDYDTFTWK